MSPEPKPILNVAKLIKRFGGFYALDGLSFHVASGEILGLVGPNGSGKTTAINVISGLYAPDGGEVVLDGVSIGGVASQSIYYAPNIKSAAAGANVVTVAFSPAAAFR